MKTLGSCMYLLAGLFLLCDVESDGFEGRWRGGGGVTGGKMELWSFYDKSSYAGPPPKQDVWRWARHGWRVES